MIFLLSYDQGFSPPYRLPFSSYPLLLAVSFLRALFRLLSAISTVFQHLRSWQNYSFFFTVFLFLVVDLGGFSASQSPPFSSHCVSITFPVRLFLYIKFCLPPLRNIPAQEFPIRDRLLRGCKPGCNLLNLFSCCPDRHI